MSLLYLINLIQIFHIFVIFYKILIILHIHNDEGWYLFVWTSLLLSLVGEYSSACDQWTTNMFWISLKSECSFCLSLGTICRYGMFQRLDYSLNTRMLHYASVFIIRRENGRFSLTLYPSIVTVYNLSGSPLKVQRSKLFLISLKGVKDVSKSYRS